MRTTKPARPGCGGVSDKIQALLTTLSRPIRDHDDVKGNYTEYGDSSISKDDSTGPTPVGIPMQPAIGPSPEISGQAPSLDEMMAKHAHSLKKVTAMTCLDVHAKPSISLTYEKLFQKVFLNITYLIIFPIQSNLAALSITHWKYFLC